MMTPVFRIFDYSKALGFYVGWSGFHLDLEDRPATGPFGNRLIFCEPVGLLRGSEQVRTSRRR